MSEKYIMYLRKSRALDKEDTTEEVLAKHEEILKEYALNQLGIEIAENDIYREVVSGETISDRVEIQKILKRITEENIEGVLVVEPQRLSRGDMLDCGTILRVFKLSNTKVYTPTKTFDLTDTYDYKFLSMDLAQSNDYLEYTKQILARGKYQAIKNGCYIAGSAPYGYKKVVIDKKHTLEIVPDEAIIVRLVFDMFVNQRLSSTRIVSELEKMGAYAGGGYRWSASRVLEMIKNPVYAGKVRWFNYVQEKKTDEQGNITTYKTSLNNRRVIFDGLHEAIIDETTFKKAQAILGTMPKHNTDKKLKNPFASVLKCGNCGYAIIYNWDRTKKQLPRLICTNQRNCKSSSAIYNNIENAIIEALRFYIDDFTVKLDNLESGNENLKTELLDSLINKRAELDKRQLQLYDYLETGVYSKSVFMSRQDKLDNDIKNIDKAIEKAKAEVTNKVEQKEKIENMHTLIDLLKDDSVDAKAKNDFIKTFIKEIKIYAPKSNRRQHPISEFSVEINFL